MKRGQVKVNKTFEELYTKVLASRVTKNHEQSSVNAFHIHRNLFCHICARKCLTVLQTIYEERMTYMFILKLTY